VPTTGFHVGHFVEIYSDEHHRAIRTLLSYSAAHRRRRGAEVCERNGREAPATPQRLGFRHEVVSHLRTTGSPFAHLFGLGDVELAAQGVMRYLVDEKPGFPDRIELRDLEPGERALLLNYVHQDADTPYRASHAMFVREDASEAYDRVDEVPDVLRVRPLSLRAFNAGGLMLDADLVDGT